MTQKTDFGRTCFLRYVVICVVALYVSIKWGGVAFASISADSTLIQFHQSQIVIEQGYNHNSEQLKQMLEGLALHPDSLYRIKSVRVVGTSSPEGTYAINMKFSEQRALALYNYLKENIAIPDSLTEIVVVGRDWRGLYTLVEADAAVPSRPEVLSILSPAAHADRITEELSNSTLSRLRMMRTPYGYLYDNLFPQLRTSRLYVGYEDVVRAATGGEPADSTAIGIAGVTYVSVDDGMTGDGIGQGYASLASDYVPYHRLALKTNLLYDVALFPNLEVEWRFNDNWSAALEGDFAWWGGWDRSEVKRFRIAVISPEVKRWIRPRAAWEGFYVGAFAGCGLYDIEKSSRGYHGEGVMGGISVGYMWRLSRCLSMEAAVGAGYLYTRYKECKHLDGHHVYQRTKDFNYVGPLKLKLSLVWRLWDVNKKARHGYNENDVR